MIGAAIVGFLAGVIGRMLMPNDPFRHMSGPQSWGSRSSSASAARRLAT